ncbi:HEAT repeat domain-containing protein [Brevibacillus sp. NRS-1366]|uniref:HEAT repeat domain-containing protein n=1 Tax=Brevibacillus sp. NRS-1366 TaxID=3233899 RepID=UPI003D1E3FD9
MEAPLATAILYLYALCALMVIGLLVLFGLKLRNLTADKNARLCQEKYRDYFVYLQAHGEEEERLKVPYGEVTQSEKQIIQKKLFELMELFTGVHRQKLIWLCEDLGLVELDRKRLNGWWKWTKVDAAYNLGMMRSKQALPDLLRLLAKSKYDPSIFIIARSIARCADDIGDLRELVLLLVKYKKNFHELLVDILSDSQVDTAPLFASCLREKDTDLVKIGLIGFLANANPSIEPALYKLSESEDKDIRIKAVKLLCLDVRYLTDQKVKEFMNHKDWEIRAMMAKAVGTLKLVDFIPMLKNAVGDSSWWVRYYSAYSLTALEVEGFAALCEILREERTGNKIQMAHQVIQEELEKGKLQLTDTQDVEKQLQYNQKLHLYQKSYRKTISTVTALER